MLSYSVDFKALKSTNVSQYLVNSTESGGYSKRNYLQDRAYFHWFRAWQIFLILTLCYMILIRIVTRVGCITELTLLQTERDKL